MKMPINAADSVALIIFVIGFIFLYMGLNLEHTGYIVLAIIEFILGIIQLIINRRTILFK